MLFFVICSAFALFPEQVLCGAQNGLALCINAVIPSLLPFMLISSCIIKSNFSHPLGVLIGKALGPLTGMSDAGCVCFITGILGGYGAGARSVLETFSEKQISKKEAERLLAFCNNAGPLFIIGTVGIGFFGSRSIGFMLFLVQIITSLICARVFSGNFRGEKKSFSSEWNYYKKNKCELGTLVTKSAIENGSAIVTACVFIITFSAILEILPFGEYPFLAGVLEVTRGISEVSRIGKETLPLVSALLSWGGMSVHFQANALCSGEFNLKTYYLGKFLASGIAFLLTKLISGDMSILILISVCVGAFFLIYSALKFLFSPKHIQQCGCRQRRHS